MSHTVSGMTTNYTWDVAAGLPVILQDSGGNTYVYGLDLISRTDGSGNQEYYLYDGLGSTVGLTDGDGDVVASYTYNAFGAIRSQLGSSPNEFTFTGEQADGTGLQYLRARYYDPESGRFLTADPFGGFVISPQSLNRYPYSVNDPVNLIDPWGLCGFRSFGDFGDCFEDAADTIRDAMVDAAQWVGEDYHWATVGATVAGVVVIVGSGGTLSPWVVGAAALTDVGFSAFGAYHSGSACVGGQWGSCASFGVTLISIPLGFGVVPPGPYGRWVGTFFTFAPLVTDIAVSWVEDALGEKKQPATMPPGAP